MAEMALKLDTETIAEAIADTADPDITGAVLVACVGMAHDLSLRQAGTAFTCHVQALNGLCECWNRYKHGAQGNRASQ
ncbi:hypothetical protein KMAL_24900 [Novacetimonas maltaceti]|uniref:Uncharacterized protein n=1 Tax=Novacetimonas maltaceti TaxID=1203393 RepID=A0A2S3VZ63_9PROT|nr:hypothetical protein KMAL_24900 [Novacetimonas maltaceti]